jgi:calcium-dependent protein kinase
MLIKELKIQSFVSHSYVLSVYSIFSDEQCVYLFMELGTDGQLFDLFQKRETLKEETIAFILKHLLDAVNYLHKSNIIHRDLKP